MYRVKELVVAGLTQMNHVQRVKALGSPMTERDRGMALALLCEAFGVKPDNMTPARTRLYSEGLADIPPAILPAMVTRCTRTRTPRWGDLPSLKELREDAEYARLELVRALGPYESCCECDMQTGWRTVTHADWVKVERCPCWHRRQAKLAELGVGGEPLALPASAEDVA